VVRVLSPVESRPAGQSFDTLLTGILMDTPTRQIAEYAASVQYESLAATSIQAATRHLIDSVACALGALDSRPATIARAIAATASSNCGASVFGLPRATTPEYAAFANTAMVRFLDYNDTGNGGHPSDMIAAVLALAEPRRARGRDVIKAMHAAYETYAAIRRGGLYGDLLRRKHVDQVQAVVGGVVGAGVTLGLDVPRMANAVALAITPNIPLRVARTGVISDWKGCATAYCAMAAVFAARLAEQGLTGPARPFEGLAGFYEMLDVGPLDLEDIGQPRNGLSAIESTGMKYYPAQYNAQGPIYSVLVLRDQFRLEEVERVTVSLHWGGWYEIGGGAGDLQDKSDPNTRETADHSMAYIIAAALADGELTVDSFSHERMGDPALRLLMQKVVVKADPQLTREHAGEMPRWPSRVEILLTDGRRLSRESGPPKGHPLHPMSDGELEAKYWSMADRALPRASGQKLLDTMWSLAKLTDITELTSQFRACGRTEPGPGR
jgi:2-methylcitrate dehydratase